MRKSTLKKSIPASVWRNNNKPMTIANTAEINSNQKYGTSRAPIRPTPWRMPLMISNQPSKRTIATDFA